MVVKARIGFATLAAALLGGGAATSAPAPAAADALRLQPRQPGITISTPTEAEAANCKVELVKGQKVAGGKLQTGWLVKDAGGRPLRRFFDSDGDAQIDVWSYYLNGEECYREVDSNFNGKADQFRWLGANGSKWGVDTNEDGRIDGWKAISAEELSQEVLAAVQTRNFARLQALMISKAEMEALELPGAEANRITAKLQAAAKKFQETTDALQKVNEKVKWVHLETGAPECIPADALGTKADLIRHKAGTILYSDGDKLHDFIQTGEMIQVGRAWRLTEAPFAGNAVQGNQVAMGGGGEIPDAAKPLIEELRKIDKKYEGATAPAQIVEYNLARAAVLEKIVAAITDARAREEWIKQVADCYSTAAQNGDKGALGRLAALKSGIAKDGAGAPVVAYIAYREMSAEYAQKLINAKPPEMTKLQDEWKDKLTKFVQDFPTAEDAPDALMQLGMVNEFMGKETEAKNWYGDLVKNFAKSPMAPKAAGAIKRLGIEGQEIELAGPTLGTKEAFDVKSLKGKVVLVYYWSSNTSQCAADFAKLKSVLAERKGKVELVTVNLDYAEADAAKFLQQNPLGGTHLFSAGGGESPLALQYGVMVLPNLFVVGADGKVVSRGAQVATIDEELKKLVK